MNLLSIEKLVVGVKLKEKVFNFEVGELGVYMYGACTC